MQNAGTALMAVGEGRGEGRAIAAARAAISSPLLDVSIDGATGVLLNVSGGPDLTLAEVTEAAETIQAAVDPDANIFFGAVIHPRQQDDVRVTVIATGLRDAALATQAPPAREREPEAPRTRYTAPEPSQPPRETARETEYERTRRPSSTEWERSRPRQEPRPAAPPPGTPAPQGGEDDWDVPAFLRRPRR